MFKNIKILDTTLRDGEQSPGAVLKPEDKIIIAKALEELGVDIIEAGFPISSPGDFKAVKKIAQEIKNTTVCAFARAVEKDIKTAWESIKSAKNPRIHIVISTSDIHLKYQLNKSKEEVIDMVNNAVKLAKSYTDNIEFSPMDATRTNPEYLCKVIQVAVDAGATVINIPDTVGYALPWEIETIINIVKKKVKNIGKVELSIHCHNDLGLGVINTLSAIKAGVSQIECTINGLGERAGNASLEEIVMLLKVRGQTLGFTTNINTKKIFITSKLVSKLTHIPVQPNKAIVGRNAFAHSSGIHQDGLLKNLETYQILKATDIGLKSSRIVLTARSGKHALKYRLSLLGITLSEEDLIKVYQKFLIVADKKRIVTTKDLYDIIK